MKTYDLPKDAPRSISLQWGDPPKPNLWQANLMFPSAPRDLRSRVCSYEIKSPLFRDRGEDSVYLMFEKPSEDLPTLMMTLKYMVDGKLVSFERVIPDNFLTEAQIQGYLRMFWEKNKRVLKETLIRQEMRVASDLSQYQVDQLFSNIRNQEVRDMKVASSGTDIMWGDPPKPNLWSVERLPWEPNTGGGDFYIVRSPLMVGGILVNFHRIQGIRRDDMFVSVRNGEKYTDEVIVDLEIHNGVPHLARTDKNYGAWLTYAWQNSRRLQELVKSKLKANVKLASDLSQYRIDPRFVKPAPKKMTRTAGEVRFVKDNSNDASSWAWGDTGASERRIPADFVFKKHAQKALAKTMRSSLSAMGHALSAYHTFTKIKSADVSPDGALGGRGYIQKVAHMRRAYMNVAEALSALSDTIYDEINAPHWSETGTPKEVKEIMEEAEEIREDPEAWAEEQQENSKEESES